MGKLMVTSLTAIALLLSGCSGVKTRVITQKEISQLKLNTKTLCAAGKYYIEKEKNSTNAIAFYEAACRKIITKGANKKAKKICELGLEQKEAGNNYTGLILMQLGCQLNNNKKEVKMK